MSNLQGDQDHSNSPMNWIRRPDCSEAGMSGARNLHVRSARVNLQLVSAVSIR